MIWEQIVVCLLHELNRKFRQGNANTRSGLRDLFPRYLGRLRKCINMVHFNMRREMEWKRSFLKRQTSYSGTYTLYFIQRTSSSFEIKGGQRKKRNDNKLAHLNLRTMLTAPGTLEGFSNGWTSTEKQNIRVSYFLMPRVFRLMRLKDLYTTCWCLHTGRTGDKIALVNPYYYWTKTEK